MFPRAAAVIAALLVCVFVGLFVRGQFVAQQLHCAVDCNRGIAYPYQQLLARMRQLAEAGQTEELRALITRAHERGREMSDSCGEHSEDSIYLRQVGELLAQ